MSMDRRGFFGRLFGAAAAAPLVAKELAKVPAAVPPIGIPANPVLEVSKHSFIVPNGTYCISVSLPSHDKAVTHNWGAGPSVWGPNASAAQLETLERYWGKQGPPPKPAIRDREFFRRRHARKHPQQEALERFDREWKQLRGKCLLEGGEK